MKASVSVLLALGLLAAGPALPAWAETIHMKNGTQVVGTITKEDAEFFTVETKEGRRKLAKKDVETYPPADPNVALATGVLVPGGGQFYQGDLQRGLLFLGIAALTATAGYLAARQIRPSSPSAAAVTAIVLYEIPAIAGAVDARNAAQNKASQPHFRIDYESAQ
jgi:hypothetical protein